MAIKVLRPLPLSVVSINSFSLTFVGGTHEFMTSSFDSLFWSYALNAGTKAQISILRAGIWKPFLSLCSNIRGEKSVFLQNRWQGFNVCVRLGTYCTNYLESNTSRSGRQAQQAAGENSPSRFRTKKKCNLQAFGQRVIHNLFFTQN